jgi:hypothetical protein
MIPGDDPTLRRASPTRQDHYYMNFGGPGEDGIADDRAIEKILGIAQRFRLRKIVYAMDLNDILPDKGAPEARHSPLYKTKLLVRQYLDVLRNRSYVYNFLRLKLTEAAVRMGYGYHGDEAFELHPLRNAAIVNQTAERINKLSVRLKQHEVDLCVVLFPLKCRYLPTQPRVTNRTACAGQLSCCVASRSR